MARCYQVGAQVEAVVEPNGVLNDFSRKSVALVSGSRVFHPGMVARLCLAWQYRLQTEAPVLESLTFKSRLGRRLVVEDCFHLARGIGNCLLYRVVHGTLVRSCVHLVNWFRACLAADWIASSVPEQDPVKDVMKPCVQRKAKVLDSYIGGVDRKRRGRLPSAYERPCPDRACPYDKVNFIRVRRIEADHLHSIELIR